MKHAPEQPAQDGATTTYFLELRTPTRMDEHGRCPAARLQGALKVLSRRFGLRCTAIGSQKGAKP